MVDINHNWSDLDGEYALLECNRTGVDFWDIERGKVEYCPACGDQL